MRFQAAVYVTFAFLTTAFAFGALSVWEAQRTTVSNMDSVDMNAASLRTVARFDGRLSDKPVAVVELFTSEGCSSCPSADVNLQRIASESESSGSHVFTLSFHVDYWDYLGWKDPFSSEEYSERQRKYAGYLKSRHVYTPQMIVSGEKEFVGSDQKLSDSFIQESLSHDTQHGVELSLAKRSDSNQGPTKIRYSVTHSPNQSNDLSKYLLNVAVVSEKESVSVKRGENEGRKLSHVSVVKKFVVSELNSDMGSLSIDTRNLGNGPLRIVAYVQSKETFQITGANALDL